MSHGKRVARITIVIFSIVTLIALLQGVLLYLNITFTSDWAGKVIAEQLKTLTHRDAYVDGQAVVTLSLSPVLRVDGIRIENRKTFGEENFISISQAYAQVSLLSLLKGTLHIDQFSADKVEVNLVKKNDGSNNWSFDLLPDQEAAGSKEQATSTKYSYVSNISFDEIRLTDISVKYDDELLEQPVVNYLQHLVINIENEDEPRFVIAGTIDGSRYEIELITDSFANLIAGEVWTIDGSGQIADRHTSIRGNTLIDNDASRGTMELEVEDVDLGLLMEKLKIISGEHAYSNELKIKIDFQGNDIAETFRKSKLQVEIRDGYWQRRSTGTGEVNRLIFNTIKLNTSWTDPVDLHFDGMLSEEVLTFDIKSNRLEKFFDEVEKIDLDLSANVAGSDLTLSGTLDLPLKLNQFQLDIVLDGKDLEKLNKVLDSEFPPFNNYRLAGKITANEKGFIINSDDSRIGETHFKTVIVIDTSSYKPHWTINLNSKQFQIKDFEFINSKLEQIDPVAIKDSLASRKAASDSNYVPGRRLKDLVDDPRMHFDLNLNVENVLAGETALGSSSFRMKLRDDTLILEDAVINVPGGIINLYASFISESDKVKGTFKLDIEKFEYGAVARYFSPSSPEGGVISANIDVQLGGADFSRLFDEANGKLDVALWPRNSKTRMFDLWATNLFFIILPEIRKKESRMNCLVALLDIDDGIMKEDFFGIDTTKVWMTGNINVDFKDEYVKLSLYPRSKTAKLFAVQAPIRAEGGFSDMHLVTNPIDITAAYVSFITSPLHVPARRIFEDKVPEDASEACERFFDRDYVKALKDKIEAEEQKEIDEWLESP